MANKEPDATDESAPSVAEVKKSKISVRHMMWSVFILAFLLSVMGVVMALTSHVQDPSKIQMATQVNIKDPEPAASAVEVPEDEALTMQLPVTESDMGQEVTPDASQEESTIELHDDDKVMPQSTPLPEEMPLIREEQMAPQSMIHWESEPALAAVAAPKIVIVIDDMGLNVRNSNRVAAFKSPLTLAYMPYASNLAKQTAEARGNGHELIVHMPMEPVALAQNNPGPNALLTKNTHEENLIRLKKNLSSFEGYIGLNNHMGSAMTADRAAMEPVMQEIKKLGLWFLDSRTAANSVAGKLADELNVPYVSRDVFLDNNADVAAITRQLNELKIIASKRGYAVGIGHPYDATITALNAWLPQAAAQGFQITPLSSVIAQRFPQASLPEFARHTVAAKAKATNASQLN
jgi:polysaccharide deacetylase 2 family uncharacterized protein YibQ